jgi:hypothetical protein
MAVTRTSTAPRRLEFLEVTGRPCPTHAETNNKGTRKCHMRIKIPSSFSQQIIALMLHGKEKTPRPPLLTKRHRYTHLPGSEAATRPNCSNRLGHPDSAINHSLLLLLTVFAALNAIYAHSVHTTTVSLRPRPSFLSAGLFLSPKALVWNCW